MGRNRSRASSFGGGSQAFSGGEGGDDARRFLWQLIMLWTRRRGSSVGRTSFGFDNEDTIRSALVDETEEPCPERAAPKTRDAVQAKTRAFLAELQKALPIHR